MTLKATIEIAINFDTIQIRQLMRTGFIRYCLRLYYINPRTNAKIICHPYNILRHQNDSPLPKQDKKQRSLNLESQIDSNSEFYHSSVISISYREADYPLRETVYFKVYIDTALLERVELKCEALLHFGQELSSKFSKVGSFQANIKKLYNVGCYLPVFFDDFGGFQICGSYHATILEFKFEKMEDDNDDQNDPQKIEHFDFWSYLEASTKEFNQSETRKFYNLYRNVIEQQYQNLQERLHQFKRAVRQGKSWQPECSEENLTKLGNLMVRKLSIKYDESPLSVSNKSQPLISSPLKKLSLRSIPANTELIHLIDSLVAQKKLLGLSNLRNRITEAMLEDFTNIKAYVYQKWHQYTQLVHQNSTEITLRLRNVYDTLTRERFRSNIFSHKIKNHDWSCSKYQDRGKSNIECAGKQKLKRDNIKQLWQQSFPIQNNKFFGKFEGSIKIFEEIYVMPSQSLPIGKSHRFLQTVSKSQRILPNKRRSRVSKEGPLDVQKEMKAVPKKHLIVLVHGFQATRTDFMLLKNCLQVNYQVQVLLSFSNEGHTQDSLETSGKRLAVEVATHLANRSDECRISFIGHSMGGLIIRSALVYLQNIEDKLHSYISICTPHLGYLYEPSALVQAGLWILNTWQKCQSIQQLCLNDNAKNPRQTFLYKLAQQHPLKHFKHISFITSPQDQYVPYESARVQKNLKVLAQLHNNSQSNLICEMVDNILENVTAVQISRIDVVFSINNPNFDSFIGRTGHVQFLSDVEFLKQFVMCFQRFFN